MTSQRIDALLAAQRAYFQTGQTLDPEFRIRMLQKLRDWVRNHEKEIAAALQADLGKCPHESYLCETGMVLSELSWLLRHTRRFAKRQRVRTPLAQFRAISYTQAVPYGNCLIMSPWNYPLLLTLDPLADAIAAGNTAIVKPSAYAPATARLLETMARDCFPEEYVAVVTGGREENARLLEKKWDFVFFTGSQAVGKVVLQHTAPHLTPAVLELGGKSPVIVDETADLSLAARRIVFGKLINCGQTCVAPDYILCQRSVKDQLVQQLQQQFQAQIGNALENESYGRMVNRKHFDRVCGLINSQKVAFGGASDMNTLQIAPTVLDNVSWEDPVMQEEIFGPVLPVLTFEDFSQVYDLLKDRPKPLALYLFSRDKARMEFVTTRIPFGGGCINDTIIHLATEQMGFGGVGESGMGAYHGMAGLEAFSHRKSIVDKKNWIDLPMRYRPYTLKNLRLIRRFLK